MGVGNCMGVFRLERRTMSIPNPQGVEETVMWRTMFGGLIDKFRYFSLLINRSRGKIVQKKIIGNLGVMIALNQSCT